MTPTEAGLGSVTEHLLDLLRTQAGQLLVAHANAGVAPRPAVAGAGCPGVGGEGHDGEHVADGVTRVPDGGDLGQMGADGIRNRRAEADGLVGEAKRGGRGHVGVGQRRVGHGGCVDVS